MHFLLQRMHKATNALNCLGDYCIRRGVGQAHKAGAPKGEPGTTATKLCASKSSEKVKSSVIVLPSSDFPMAERISSSR